MKFLIVLASVFGVGLCQLILAGGRHTQPASQFPRFLTMALKELPGLRATDHTTVTRVQTQVLQ